MPPPAELPGGMKAYWGHLHAHTTYSDGAGPPFYALAMARAAGLHFYGTSDHAWWLTENEWERTLPQVVSATAPGQFVALRGQEWSHAAVGHINLFNTDTLVQRTVRVLFPIAAGLLVYLVPARAILKFEWKHLAEAMKRLRDTTGDAE